MKKTLSVLPLLLLAMCGGRPDLEDIYKPKRPLSSSEFQTDPKHPDRLLNHGKPMREDTYGPGTPAPRPEWDDKDLRPRIIDPLPPVPKGKTQGGVVTAEHGTVSKEKGWREEWRFPPQPE